jgi:hypothetical protein
MLGESLYWYFFTIHYQITPTAPISRFFHNSCKNNLLSYCKNYVACRVAVFLAQICAKMAAGSQDLLLHIT